MSSVTEKPYCLVCSTEPYETPKTILKIKICSKQCQRELWRHLGIFRESIDMMPKSHSKKLSMTGLEILAAEGILKVDQEKK